MDILGYREMIRESSESGTQEDLLRRLHTALTEGRKWLEGHGAEKRYSGKDSYALKAFTDNIVIAWPILDDAESELGHAFVALAFFQMAMSMEGFFVRGGLSIGEAYVDEIAVFGGALNSAYLGESTLARDPRIILTESAVSAVKTHINYYSNPASAPQLKDILQDADGQWFVNYLNSLLIAEHEHGPYVNELLRHKSAVQEQLDANRGRPSVWAKYAWVAGYHNFFCDHHGGYFDESHKIDINQFRASPAVIVPPKREQRRSPKGGASPSAPSPTRR